MNKALEFLGDLHVHTHYEQTDIESKKVILSAYAYLKKRLTPPTKQEVCHMLEKYLDDLGFEKLGKVKYTTNPICFYYYDTEDYEQFIVEYNEFNDTITFNFSLPRNIALEITRFYEGVNNNE